MDIDDVVKSDDGGTDDLITITKDLGHNINWKVALFLFAISLFVMSDLFVEKFLSLVNNTVDIDTPNNKGTIIQVMVIVFSYIVVDLFVKREIL